MPALARALGKLWLLLMTTLPNAMPPSPGDKTVCAQAKQNEKAFDTALATRNFEIGLFWQRSLFFWGFIGAAFVGYATLRKTESSLSLVFACFGLVCSVAWSLANRGSKYWQESWESKVNRTEDAVTGPLFKIDEPPRFNGSWLSSRRYSVSRLTIAIADYVAFVWCALIVWELFRIYGPSFITSRLTSYAALGFVIASVGFCGFLILKGQSNPQSNTN